MPRPGRPTVPINLSGDERNTLQRWARRHSSSQALALRCRIVLACAEGDRTHAEIAGDLGCNPVDGGVSGGTVSPLTVSTGWSMPHGRRRSARSATT